MNEKIIKYLEEFQKQDIYHVYNGSVYQGAYYASSSEEAISLARKKLTNDWTAIPENDNLRNEPCPPRLE